MADLSILKSTEKDVIEKIVLEDKLIKSIVEKYSKIINIFLSSLDEVTRWNNIEKKGLRKNITETDKIHVIEMIYIALYYFKKYPSLNGILSLEKIIIKIALHDLGEIGVGDLSYNEQIKLTYSELKKHKKKEKRFALKLINNLNKQGFDDEDITLLKKYYLDYETNKNNPNSLNNYFVKFIDLYQAFLHIINHLEILHALEENSLDKLIDRLKEFNIHFKKFGFDLLIDSELKCVK